MCMCIPVCVRAQCVWVGVVSWCPPTGALLAPTGLAAASQAVGTRARVHRESHVLSPGLSLAEESLGSLHLRPVSACV